MKRLRRASEHSTRSCALPPTACACTGVGGGREQNFAKSSRCCRRQRKRRAGELQSRAQAGCKTARLNTCSAALEAHQLRVAPPTRQACRQRHAAQQHRLVRPQRVERSVHCLRRIQGDVIHPAANQLRLVAWPRVVLALAVLRIAAVSRCGGVKEVGLSWTSGAAGCWERTSGPSEGKRRRRRRRLLCCRRSSALAALSQASFLTSGLLQ